VIGDPRSIGYRQMVNQVDRRSRHQAPRAGPAGRELMEALWRAG
jgi:hypothetical protein